MSLSPPCSARLSHRVAAAGRRPARSALAAAAALAFSAAPGQAATLINFDGLAGGTIFSGELVTTQYAALGVTFADSYSGGAHANTALGAYIPGSTAPNVLWVDQSSGGLPAGQYLQISFASAVNGVQALYGTSTAATLTVNAYSGATLIHSATLTGATLFNDVRSGTFTFNDSGITSLRLSSTAFGNSYNFSIDNLAIGIAPAVPEPGSAALLLAGLAAMGWRIGSRRKTA